jgi:hypothetical protein
VCELVNWIERVCRLSFSIKTIPLWP